MSRLGWGILIAVVVVLIIGAAAIAPLCWGSRYGYGYGYGGMMAPWMMGGFGGFGMLFGGLFLVLIVVGVSWLVAALARGSASGGSNPRGESPLDILKRRYAAGDITQEQYAAMKRELGV